MSATDSHDLLDVPGTPSPAPGADPAAPATNLPGPPPAGDHARIAFLGPFGTFSEQAVWQVAPGGAELLPMTSAPVALEAVREGRADRAVVPIENSVEGGVNATLDSLTSGDPLFIVAEMVVAVQFDLAVRPGTAPEWITRVGTHPHAWAQCRRHLEAAYPGVVHVPATSTAAGAQLLSQGDTTFDAALCPASATRRYGLTALESGLNDQGVAVTRFIMVAPPGSLPPPTGADKTTIQVALPHNESGSLLTMLEQFSVRGVDLSRIESRPAGDHLGSYTFSIDIIGHVAEERVQAALVGLHRYSPEVRFMGSYPRVDGVRADVLPGTSDRDFREGRAWVKGILRGGDGTVTPDEGDAGWPLGR